ncbi:histidinol-phosphate transaminase [Bacillus sp. DJP31]|uniref:histidinol-phosphate transaminase n=1 Tax=Bacillus sp. DJP31 TaxID=3409789 RepID=UPI003BB7E057
MNIQSRPEVQAITPYVLGKKVEEVQKEYGLSPIRKLSENENVYGCSPKVKEFLSSNLDQLHLYPDGLASSLAEIVSDYLHVLPTNLVFGNGSDEVIRILVKTYINPSDEAVMADITFPRYKSNILIEGGKPVIVPVINGTHHLDGMLEAITEKTKMVFLCNPNNPTGTIVGKEELESFLRKIPSQVLVIIDEAYYEYVTSADYLQTVPLLNEFPNFIILRTFSKIYGLASLRIGYGIMHEEIVTELRKVKDVFNVNQMAQIAAEISIKDEDHLNDCRVRNDIERKYLESEFEKLGLTFFPSQSNFVMVDCQCLADEMTTYVLKEGIMVRSGSLLGVPNMIRYTIGTKEDNELFLSLLQQNLMTKGEILNGHTT